MEKMKCYKLIDPAKRGYIGHVIPVGKGKQSAIIMVAGGTPETTNKALDVAIAEAPEHYRRKYDLEKIEG